MTSRTKAAFLQIPAAIIEATTKDPVLLRMMDKTGLQVDHSIQVSPEVRKEAKILQAIGPLGTKKTHANLQWIRNKEERTDMIVSLRGMHLSGIAWMANIHGELRSHPISQGSTKAEEERSQETEGGITTQRVILKIPNVFGDQRIKSQTPGATTDLGWMQTLSIESSPLKQ